MTDDHANEPLRQRRVGGAGALKFLCTALLTLACAHGQNANPYSDWVDVHSYSFSLFTDTSAGTYKDIVGEIEAMNAALTRAFFPNTEVRGIEVLLFSTPESERKAVAAAGVPFVRPDTRPIVLTARTSARTRERNISNYSTPAEQQMATELVTRMLRANMRNAPPWFRIGLQEYVQTVEVQGNVARFGHRLPRPTHELAAGRVIPLGKLIEATNADFNGGDWRLSHRASAWAFIHYLLGGERGTLRPRFDAIARALIDADDGSAATSRAAIEKAFAGVDFATLEGKVHDYAVLELGQRNFFHPMTIEFTAPPEREYPTEPADPNRLRGLLAGLKR
jgi:hypothetical protein